MKKFKNLTIICLILILPVVLYYLIGPSPAESSSVNINNILGTKKPVVLDFSSQLCLECKELNKVLTPIMPKYQDKIIFKKVLVNSMNGDNQKLIDKYGVNVVPTLVFIDKKGKVVRTTEGSMSKEQLQGYLDKLING